MRKILILCVSLGILTLVCMLGPAAYRKWRSEKAFHNAEAALAQKREKEAMLSIQESLHSDPENLPATRLMVQMLEQRHSPATILWNRRLSQLAPNEAEPRLAWLREALSSKDLTMARSALDSFPPNQQQGPLFHHLASSEALLRKDWRRAEFHAAEALRLDPNNPILELNLASVRLQAEDPDVVAQAQAMLTAMQKKEKTSVAATRVLITDALRRGDFARAADLSRILLPSSSASFGDRLQLVAALEGMKSPELETELIKLQVEASPETGKSIRLAEWLLQHKRPAEAQAFIAKLSPVMLEDPLLRILRATADAETGEWAVLQHRLKSEIWDDSDYLRLAFIARALKETRQESGAKNEWTSAGKSAAKVPHGLYVLASTVMTWPNWEDETSGLMWTIADGYRYPVWALSYLHRYYLAKGDTRSLLRVTRRWRDIQTSDPVLNNLAQYSLLLKQDITMATALAQTNFKNHPQDPAYRATYAFALNQSGKNSEALQLMAGLPAAAWESPEICAYQAIFLAQDKKKEEAASFRKKAEKATLLPEERELLEKAFSN